MPSKMRSFIYVLAIMAAWALCGMISSTLAWAQATTTRVSVGSGGEQGDGASYCASLSADGRYAAFVSYASNFVPGDTNGVADVFVHDRQTATTTRASVSSQGVQGNDNSTSCPVISGDGRYVAFTSKATNLVGGNTNGFVNVFVHDTVTDETTLVSVGSGGVPADNDSQSPGISADGRFVAFDSYASNLVPDDTNNTRDVFVYDRSTGTMKRVSVSSEGAQGNNTSFSASLNADGHLVAFVSMASNLVAGDTTTSPLYPGIFVHDLLTGATTLEASGRLEPALSADGHFVAFGTAPSPSMYQLLRDNVYVRDRVAGTTMVVSIKTSANTLSDGDSYSPVLSADGRFVAFSSDSPFLILDDTNASTDVFVYDRVTATMSRVSVDSSGEQANRASGGRPAISADGRFVAFHSTASNLVKDDTNDTTDVFVLDRDGDGGKASLTVGIDPSGGGTIAGQGINCPGDCSETFTAPQTVILSATPGTGWAFDSWTGCDSVAGDQCTAALTSGTRRVTAVFTETSPVLTAQIFPGDTGDYSACTSTATCGGTVTGPGINCPGDCNEPYGYSQTVTVTATAKPGYIFRQWPYGAGAGVLQCDGILANQCTVTMTHSRQVIAEFATGLTVSVNPENGGAVTGYGISCPGDCIEYYSPSLGNYSSSAYTVTLTQTAKPGYTFGGWTGCTLVSGSECYVTLNSPKTVAATFTTSTTTPTAPINLSATAASSIQINLGWMNTATNATTVLVERSANGTTFTQIATVAGSATSYQDAGLMASTTYSYRVRASNSAGFSGYSNVAMATTLAPPTPPPTAPAAPTNLTAAALSATQARLTWTDNSNNEGGFAIERSTSSAGGFAQVATVSTNVSTYTDSGVTAGTFYYYRVRAFNAVGSSAYSNLAKVRTARK